MVSRTLTYTAEAAFALRKENFPDQIQFYAPGLKRYSTASFEQSNPQAFLPISLTGSACALQCDHCAAKILEPMIPLNPKEGLFALCQRMAATGTEGILISGGSKRTGEVPLTKHLKDITRIKEELGLKVMVHSGLVDEKMAEGLKNAGIDGVAIDIMGSEETIREVYHLDAKVEDFERSLQILSQYELSIRPHIILGLHYGKFLGEYTALEMISKYPVHALVIVILTPMLGTPMKSVTPPDRSEVEQFFIKSRLQMPQTLIMLGCARPGGEYKEYVDFAAIDAGLNGIAFPAEGVVEYAQKRGLEVHFYENSCSCGC